MVLVMRTDSSDAELHLIKGERAVSSRQWQAYHQLSDTLHSELIELLADARAGFSDIAGVVAYQGPGSFTGLRIGLATANAYAYSLHVPIVGVSGDSWIIDGIKKISTAKAGHYIQPMYGADPRTTRPRK